MSIPTGFPFTSCSLLSSTCNHQQATRGRPSALQKGPSPALPADPPSACVQALSVHHFGAALVQQAAASSKRELTSLLPLTLPSLLHTPTQCSRQLLTGRPSFASPRMSNYNDTLPSNRLAGWDPVGTEVEQWSIFIGLHASSVVLLSTLCVLIWWSNVKRPPVVIMVRLPLPGLIFDLTARS